MKKTLIRISALAVMASPFWGGSARAQTLKLTCKQNIDIGNLIASGCTGDYIISPNSVHNNTNCLLINNTAVAGTCSVKVVGGAATKSAVLTFQKGFFTMVGSKGGTAKMTNLRMKNRTQATITPTLTFATATLNGGPITVDIGGTLNYTDGQTEGTYTGKVALSINFN